MGRYIVYPYTVLKGSIKTVNVFLYVRTVDFCKDKHPVMGSKRRERMMTLKQYWVPNCLYKWSFNPTGKHSGLLNDSSL